MENYNTLDLLGAAIFGDVLEGFDSLNYNDYVAVGKELNKRNVPVNALYLKARKLVFNSLEGNK